MTTFPKEKSPKFHTRYINFCLQTFLYLVLVESWLLPPSAANNLQRKIGQGGYGTVYLSALNGTLVAVKKCYWMRTKSIQPTPMKFKHLG